MKEESIQLDFNGHWKTDTGVYIHIIGFDAANYHWIGCIMQENGDRLDPVHFDLFGHCTSNSTVGSLTAKKRGTEPGWPSH